MVERVRFNPKNSSKSITPTQARFALFDQSQLLEGEDAGAYDELLGRLCAAVKSVDIIDEMFTVDVAHLAWEVLRWRRLKFNLIRARQVEALKIFVYKDFEYDLRSEHFVDYLAGILQDNLPEEEANAARTLASKCAQDYATHAIDCCPGHWAIPIMTLEHLAGRSQNAQSFQLGEIVFRCSDSRGGYPLDDRASRLLAQ
jgi:hypothetical protein